MPLDLAALAVEIREPSGRGQPTELTPPAEPATTLASLTAEHQAAIVHCNALMDTYITAKNTAEQAHNEHTLLSAHAEVAWQNHREQNFIACQLHDQWRAALRERQNIFEELRKLEGLLRSTTTIPTNSPATPRATSSNSVTRPKGTRLPNTPPSNSPAPWKMAPPRSANSLTRQACTPSPSRPSAPS